jgi:hypothetical protein
VNSVIKDPDAVLNYGHDWADGGDNDGASDDTGWLQSATISTSAWTVTGPDALLVVDSDANDTTTTSVVLSGGTVPYTYNVINHIVTGAGHEDDRSIQVKVVER